MADLYHNRENAKRGETLAIACDRESRVAVNSILTDNLTKRPHLAIVRLGKGDGLSALPGKPASLCTKHPSKPLPFSVRLARKTRRVFLNLVRMPYAIAHAKRAQKAFNTVCRQLGEGAIHTPETLEDAAATLESLANDARRGGTPLAYYHEALLMLMDILAANSKKISDDLYFLLQSHLDFYHTNIIALPYDRRSIESFLERFSQKETKSYKKRLKADFLKKRIPHAYRTTSAEKLQEKALFLQPRSGLNQTFKHMYEFLDQRGGYQLELWELHRSEVPFSFYYRNAEDMAASAGTAKVVFLHESNNLLGRVDVRPDSKIIQLWHGCGVFKKIGLDTAGLPGHKSIQSYKTYPEYSYYSCVTIASPELSWVFEQFMGIPQKAGIIKPLGVSRTDCFFDENYRTVAYEKLYRNIPQARKKKVILYAPTYRGIGQKRLAPGELDISAMHETLADDYILVVKHHQTATQLPPIPAGCESFAFDMTRGTDMDIGELLTVADVCISDYSSLVFEFSLFERPIAFFVYDLEDYIDERGLYYDFEEITPGPLCKTTDEIIAYLKEIRDHFDSSEVAAFKNRFMRCCDGHATERIVAYIEGDE